MRPSIRFSFFIFVCGVLAMSVNSDRALAIDEAESLAILVEAIDANEAPQVRNALLKGMLRGLEGRRQVDPPKGWSRLSTKLASSNNDQIRNRAFQLSQIFGDQTAADRALSLITDTDVELSRRRSMLRLLLNQQSREASMLLESLLDDSEMQLDAIRGFAVVERADGPAILLERFPDADDRAKRAIVETLTSRQIYAKELLKAIDQKHVAREDIPTHVARSLRDQLGDDFVKVFGQVKKLSQDRSKDLAKYKKLCRPAAIKNANESRGRLVFQKTCAACHQLYGEGGSVGPDLTGSNRANLDYILLNSVDPSGDVPDAYRTVSILTVDGRVINGVLAEEDASRVVLKTPDQPRVVIAKEDIDQRKLSAKSMMPDGQLDQMEKQEVLDLIKYLRTTEQVELPE